MNRKREAYDRLAVGDRIRKKRVQLGFSQDEVAESICNPPFEIVYCIYADFVESVIMNHAPGNSGQILWIIATCKSSSVVSQSSKFFRIRGTQNGS